MKWNTILYIQGKNAIKEHNCASPANNYTMQYRNTIQYNSATQSNNAIQESKATIQYKIA
jgi:hypothetical protein